MYIPTVPPEILIPQVKPVETRSRLSRNHPNKAVIMAGGLGSRLGELTRDLPKPMLKVGDKPVLEYLIRSLARFGFEDVYICVHYRADVIKSYFGDGYKFGTRITYVEESFQMGTGGGLSLIRDKIDAPFVLMNADILTSLNFESLLDFHLERDGPATMCVSEHAVKIPFGVVRTEDGRLIGMEEKPQHRVWVNAGIYVLDPKVLPLIPDNQRFDITGLFEELLRKEIAVNSYIINEFWMDIGRRADFQRARTIFE